MKTIKLSTTSRSLADYADEFSGEIVLLTKRNKAVAAIVPLKGVSRESIALSAHPEFLRIIVRSRAQFERGQTMSLAEMKAAFGGKRLPNHDQASPSQERRSSPSSRRQNPKRRSSKRDR